MCRCGEDGFVQNVFPVSGELTFGDDLGFHCVRASAVTDDYDIVAQAAGRRRAQLEHRHAQSAQRLHQSESSGHVISQRVTFNGGAAVRRYPDRLGFRDEVADRKD